jgi:hypothetical protein
MNDPTESPPAGAYEPDESFVQSLFARPARQPKPKAEVFVAGHSFGGIDPAEADRLRWENLHRRPVRVKEEKR